MDVWVLDWETYWDTDYTLSKMTTDAYVLDPRFEVQGLAVRPPSGGYYYFLPEHVPRLLASINWGKAAIACHNTAFDGFILRHRYRTPEPKLWIDTLSMARFVLPGSERSSLANVAKFFGLPPKGDETVRTRGRRFSTFTPAERQALADYAKHDARLTWDALQIMLGHASAPNGVEHDLFPVSELIKVDRTIRMFVEPKLYLSEQKLRAFLQSTQARKADLLRRCGLDSRESLMSNEKFATALEALGVEVPMKVSPTTGLATYALSKKDPEFKELLDHEDDRVSTLVEARLDLKSTGDETRTQRLLSIAEAKRPWPVLLNYCGAKQTDRWSGGNKQNPQNLRRGGALRESIEAPPGHVIVVADSSQIEARLLACEAGQMDLVDMFRRGDDTYAALATKIYNRPINKKTDPLERQVGKTGRLGLGYGMGPPKFQLALKTDPIMPIELDLAICENVVQVYRSVDCPRIPELWRTLEHCINLMYQGIEQDFGWFRTRRNGLVLPSGFVIRYDGLHFGEHKGKRGWFYLKRGRLTTLYGAKVCENLTQAIARNIVADQLCQAMVRDARAVFGHHWVLMSHDEGVFVCPEDTAESFLKFVLEVMHRPPAGTPVEVPVAAEGGIGRTYAEAK